MYEDDKKEEAADTSVNYLFKLRGPYWDKKEDHKKRLITQAHSTYKATNNKPYPELKEISGIIGFFNRNADQLRNKQNEFEQIIGDLKLTIITINEVKPKNLKCLVTTPEVSLEGHTIFSQNIENQEGRGMYICRS